MAAARLTVAFLGPAGTYTEEALRASSGDDVIAEPRGTVYETVMSVQKGEADRAVVPIENSLEGGVAATLDALAGEAEDVRICGEVVHPIRHCLMAASKLALHDIARVLSHPQATAQCAGFLGEQLPGAERFAATSTAEAVRLVCESDEPWAALGSRLAADLYGADVLVEGVEDRADNLTRFVWLARAADASGAHGPGSKTSIVFWGFNDESPGALVSVLRELSDRQINLTRIESRPRRVRLGHYMFFADLSGEDQGLMDQALHALGERVVTLRILGSYAAAEPR